MSHTSTHSPLTVPKPLRALAESAAQGREELLAQRAKHAVELPLRFWNQQAHFTTPASGTPGKAIRGLAAVPKLLDRFGISTNDLAEHTGAEASVFEDVLNASPHSPFVMVDVEDAVAHTAEAIEKARAGAVQCFTKDDWGTTLPFFRPAGLRLETCVEDLLTVLPACAEDRTPQNFPVAGIVWPKCEHADELRWVCDTLGAMEERLGLEEHQIKLEFLVESGHALAHLPELAQSCIDRLVGIIWGIADYSADTNLPRIANAHPLCDWARYEIVNVAGAVNVPAIDCMTLNYPTPLHRGEDLSAAQRDENKQKTLDALKEAYDDARHGIDLGMTGKWVGHPLQLLVVLAAYRDALPRKQVEKDLAEIEAYSQSVAAGAGATMLGHGRDAYMADRATDRHLRARLRRAAAWGVLDAANAESLGIITADERRSLSPH